MKLRWEVENQLHMQFHTQACELEAFEKPDTAQFWSSRRSNVKRRYSQRISRILGRLLLKS